MKYQKYTGNNISTRTVKEMHIDEQPREKLQKYGPESLTNSELLAILLRTGTKELNVVDLGKSMIDFYGGLHNMARKTWQEMRLFKGIADVKGITLQAVFELARRLNTAPNQKKLKFSTSRAAADYFGPLLRNSPKERFYAAFLDNACNLITAQQISVGSKLATVVDIPDILRLALLHDASYIVLCHNHPSESMRPSQQDEKITRKLVEGAHAIGMHVVDHIIICGYNFFSFSDEGLL